MANIKITHNNALKGSLKVAFATDDMENIDSHFGSAKQFALYEVNEESSIACEIIKIEDKDVNNTIKLLGAIDLIYFTNIGAAAAAKIINHGIFPIKYKEIVPIQKELDKLAKMLKNNPPPFIKKIIEKKAA
jgi:nitrogen fixation protein NifX